MNNIILYCDNITKSYGERLILKHVSISVQKGERIALVGPSGSGKTTLLNCLSGIDKINSGEVHLGGVNLSDCTERELALLRRNHIGTVFQFFHLLPTLTAAENIELPLILKNTNPARRKEAVSSLLEETGLTHRAHALPNQLSGGEMQRVAIARALAVQPAIIFADEPTGNLDSKTGEDILNLLKKVTTQHNTALVLVTHSVEAAAICSRRLSVKDGEILDIS